MRTSVVALFAVVLAAATATAFDRIPAGAVAEIRRPDIVGEPKELSLRLASEPKHLLLRRVAVFAQDAQIVQHTPSGDRFSALPEARYYSGGIAGERESLAFLTVADRISGFVFSDGHLFSIGPRPGVLDEGDAPIVASEMPASGSAFVCDVERAAIDGFSVITRSVLPSGMRLRSDAALSPTSHFLLRISLDIDDQLFSTLGNSVSNATAYAAALVGAASAVYDRDLRTTLTLGTLHIYAPGTCPFTQTGSSAALEEYGTYYAYNRGSEARSAAVLMSGKSLGGVAWVDGLCGPDIIRQNGSYSGAYAIVGNSLGVVNTTDPAAATFWDVSTFAHELGHNVGSVHTHCIPLTGPDLTTYGRTFVDYCAARGFDCYSGPVSVPPEKGTIMSYCNELGQGNVRLLFGKSGEASHVVQDSMTGLINGRTPVIGPIAAAVSVAANSTGNVASIDQPYETWNIQWTITGGTITAGETTRSVTYTAGTASPVVLSVVVTNARGCGKTDTKSVPLLNPAAAAPANLQATATSTTQARLTWSPVAGAVRYDIIRSWGATPYVDLASSSTTTFDDAGLSPSTTYLYRVRAVFADNRVSAYGAVDPATTVMFTDDPLTAGRTIRAIHIMELRSAVSAMRFAAGLGTFFFANSPLSSGVNIRVIHLTDLRTALAAARSALGMPALTFTDPTLTARTTRVKAVHLSELRAGVR